MWGLFAWRGGKLRCRRLEGLFPQIRIPGCLYLAVFGVWFMGSVAAPVLDPIVWVMVYMYFFMVAGAFGRWLFHRWTGVAFYVALFRGVNLLRAVTWEEGVQVGIVV